MDKSLAPIGMVKKKRVYNWMYLVTAPSARDIWASQLSGATLGTIAFGSALSMWKTFGDNPRGSYLKSSRYLETLPKTQTCLKIIFEQLLQRKLGGWVGVMISLWLLYVSEHACRYRPLWTSLLTNQYKCSGMRIFHWPRVTWHHMEPEHGGPLEFETPDASCLQILASN